MRTTARGIVIKDNQVLLMYRVRNGEHYYSIPGGGVEEGESPDTAEFREIFEEYGVLLKRSTYLGSYTEEGPKLNKHKICFFGY